MTQVWQHSRLWLAETVFIGSALSLLASPTLAQIVPDTSLGAESSRFTPNSTVREQAADRIDGGAVRGANLFHSFSDFNVNDGQRVYFSNPVGVNNILSRVTGTTLSNISGTLGVDGGANLFLLNPNGIIFGPNARLDISGSFVGSTADRFVFPAGGEFSATNPQAPPLLTVSLPLGLQYGRGDIANRGNLTAGQDLALYGNTLDLQGQLQAGRDLTLQAQEIVQARDSQTVPFVASAGRNLSIQGNQGIDILALSHPQSQILSGGNLSLIGDGTISGDVHFASGGNFSIRSASGGLANFVSLYDPIISAVGNVDLAANYSGASLLIESQGNVRVQGTVDVTAPDTVSSFVGADAVLSTQAGLIVRSGQSSLVYGGTNQNSPPAFTGGVIPNGVTLAGAVTTAGGPVRVDAATGNVNTSSITTQGGELRLNAVEGDITATGTLSTGALDGGNISLNAGRNISTTDLNSSSDSSDETSGNGGAISLSASNDLSTDDLISSSFSGNGGAISLSASNDLSTDDLISSSFSGNGGAISLLAGGNILANDPGDDTFNFGLYSASVSGNGGAISLLAGGNISVNVSGDDIFSFGLNSSANSGNGGAITLSADGNIFVDTVAEDIFDVDALDSSSFSGNGGAISLLADGNISVSAIRSDSDTFQDDYSGNGGTITLSAQGNISTNLIKSRSYSSKGSGNGGAITLSAQGNISTEDIFSSSFGGRFFESRQEESSGNGGVIAISAQGNISTGYVESSSFSDSVDSGNGGAVTLSSGGNIRINSVNSSSNSELGNSGNGGAVAFSARGDLRMNSLQSSSLSNSGDSGNGGAIALSAGGNIRIRSSFGEIVEDFATALGVTFRDVNSFSYSRSGNSGNGGEVSLSAEGDIVGSVDRDIESFLLGNPVFNSFSIAEQGTSGQGGNVTLSAQNAISNLGILTLSSSADSGTVQIDSSGDLLVTNTRILTSQQVRIARPTLDGLDEDNPITLRVGDQGRSGSVRVASPGNITFNDSSIRSDTKGSDPAGDVTLRSGGQITFNNSAIVSNTSSTGRAGSITIESARLFLNNSELTSNTSSGGGGNIRLQGLDLLVMQNSLISTSAIEAANGGNISINTPETRGGIILGSNNSDIIATAVGGAGGQIDIQADGVIGFTEQAEPNLEVLRANSTNDISASSASGSQGIVNISARLDPTQGVVELPTDLVDASNLVAQGCAAGGVTTASDLSEFVVTGRGGLSSSPTERLSDNTAVPNWMMLDSEAEAVPTVPDAASTLPRPIDAPIVEAQGWSIGSNGEVVLIANAPTVTPQLPTPAQASCNAARN